MKQGRAAVDDPGAQIFYAEWSIDEDVSAGDLLRVCWEGHPAAGLEGGPTYRNMSLAYERMPSFDFAQEYGNLWKTEKLDRLLPGAWWSNTTSLQGPPLGEPFWLGFDVATDRSASAIVACGGGVLEVITAARGARWLGPAVMERVAKWPELAGVIADPSGPASATIEELRPLLGEKLITTKARELVAACGTFYDALEAGALGHIMHPALDDAVTKASQRAVSGAWVFARDDGGHVLVAATLAYWAQSRPVTVDEAPAVN